MSEVTVFNFNGQSQVRTVVRDGEPWFVAKDICDILELENSRQVVQTLDEDEKGVCSIYTLGGNQQMSVVSESGLYALVFKSRKPEAQAFRKWVTSEVLPAIRKTGQYSKQYSAPQNPVIDNEFNMREFRVWHEFAELCGLKDNAALISADNTVYRLRGISMLKTAQIELKTPEQERILTPTQLANYLGLAGPKEINLSLACRGFQIKEWGHWTPTDKGKKYAVLLDTGKRHTNGTMIQQLKWKESILSEFTDRKY